VKSIMIVDDSEHIRRNLRSLFSGSNDWAVCAEAVNGRDAVEKAEKLHPDFIVIDYSMPILNGLAAARELKAMNPKSPIVMFTAFKDKHLEQQARKVGISWVFSKGEDAKKVVEFARIVLRPD
jgi:DNA-binding NarL/FixJ family response regulator